MSRPQTSQVILFLKESWRLTSFVKDLCVPSFPLCLQNQYWKEPQEQKLTHYLDLLRLYSAL